MTLKKLKIRIYLELLHECLTLEHCICSGSDVDSIRLAVLTVSPSSANLPLIDNVQEYQYQKAQE